MLVQHGEAELVPHGVRSRYFARRIELRDLFGREIPAGRADVLHELLFVAGADDDARDGGALEQPVERDLRDCLACLLGDDVERGDEPKQLLLLVVRTGAGDAEGSSSREFVRIPRNEARADTADVADLASSHHLVERGERLLDWRVVVLTVELLSPL